MFSCQFQDTSAEHIYALGDVCGKAELTPGTCTASCIVYEFVTMIITIFGIRELLLVPYSATFDEGKY